MNVPKINSLSSNKTAYTDARKSHCTIPVYTNVFLKMNPWVQNMYKTSEIKILI
jgi:hypothetical protein